MQSPRFARQIPEWMILATVLSLSSIIGTALFARHPFLAAFRGEPQSLQRFALGLLCLALGFLTLVLVGAIFWAVSMAVQWCLKRLQDRA